MMHDSGDEDLRRRFAALRESDLRSAPGFDALLARAASRPVNAPPLAPLAVAAAALLLLIAGAAGVVMLRRPAPKVALASWRSPTAFLLHGPGDDILRTVPGVSASVVRLGEVTAGHNE